MYSVFEQLLKAKGEKISDICRATGIGPSTFTDWKNGRSIPKQGKLIKIADYFGVPVEYLLTGEMPKECYYIDDTTAEVAQALFENKEMRILFDAAKDANPEDLQLVAQMLLRLKRKEGSNAD